MPTWLRELLKAKKVKTQLKNESELTIKITDRP